MPDFGGVSNPNSWHAHVNVNVGQNTNLERAYGNARVHQGLVVEAPVTHSQEMASSAAGSGT